MNLFVIMNSERRREMKKKLFLFTALFILVGSAGVYTAFAAAPDQTKQKSTETKGNQKENREKIAGKLGVSVEGKSEQEIQEELSKARYEKRHELLIEHARQLGIDTEGKKDEEIILEIGKIQHGR